MSLSEIQRLQKIIRLQRLIIEKDEATEELLKKQIKLLQSMVDTNRLELINWETLRIR